jgi:hypothetical protein
LGELGVEGAINKMEEGIPKMIEIAPTSKFRNLHALLHAGFVYQSFLSPRKQENGSFVQSGKLLKKAEPEWFCLHLGDYEVLFCDPSLNYFESG